mgnify:CR=1 FL=1
MRPRPTFGGIIILVVGILLIFFGTQMYIEYVPKHDEGSLIERTVAVVDELYYKDFTAHIEVNSSVKDVVVSGHGSVESLQAGPPANINFYVMNDSNFLKWKHREKAAFILTSTGTEFKFSFIVNQTDNYHFIFDNISPSAKMRASFEAKYSRTLMVPEERENRTLNYIGAVAAAAGALICIYGLREKPIIPWK